MLSSRDAEGAPYGADESTALDRFLQKRDRTRLERALAHVLVPVSRQDDHRDPCRTLPDVSGGRDHPCPAFAHRAPGNLSGPESRIPGTPLRIRTSRHGDPPTSGDCEGTDATMRRRRRPIRPARSAHSSIRREMPPLTTLWIRAKPSLPYLSRVGIGAVFEWSPHRLTRRVGRQRKVEDSPMRLVGGGPEPAAVRLHD